MQPITELSQLDPDKLYSYADYLTWQFTETVELFKGTLFPMAAPNVRHQKVSWRLTRFMSNAFYQHPCQAFAAPFDVRLPDRLKKPKFDGDIYTVVQPDLCVICDESKLDERGCLGAPDLMIEILSPGNTKKEMKNKFRLYEEAGVLEYWLVAPHNQFVLVYVLRDEEYIGLRPQTDEDTLISRTFPGLAVDLAEVFAD
jgi:Uma2 family endonuclease